MSLETLWFILDRAGDIAAAIFWPADPTARIAIALVGGAAIVAGLLIHLPLSIRLVRLSSLRLSLDRILARPDLPRQARREQMITALKDSPVGRVGRDFIQQWRFVELSSDPKIAPARFADLITAHPLLPRGPRRKLLEALPALLLAIAALATFSSLILATSQDLPPGVAALVRSHTGDSNGITLALHASVWGIGLGILAALAGRVIEGRFDAEGEAIDARVMRLYETLASRPSPLPRATEAMAEPELLANSRALMSAFESALDRFEALAEAEPVGPQVQQDAGLGSHLEGIRSILEASNQFLREEQERSSQSFAEIQTSVSRLKNAVMDAVASAQQADVTRGDELVERLEAVAEQIARRAEAAAQLRSLAIEPPRPRADEPSMPARSLPGSGVALVNESMPALERPSPGSHDARDGDHARGSGLSGLLNRSAGEAASPPSEDSEES